MDPSSKLSICIPVYRRPELLVRCVRSIIRSGGRYRISIVISDDSADDTNSEAITLLQRDYPFIYWHRNPTNLGIDRNILQAVKLCQTDYAWLLGEDDLLTIGAVERVLNELTSESPAFLFVNYSYVSNDYKFYLKKEVAPLDQDRTLESDRFIERYAWAIGFIGACVLNRRTWKANDDFVGTYYAHVGSIIAGLPGCKVRVIAEPLVLNRAENAKSFTWAGQAFEVFYGWERMLKQVHSLTNGSFDLGSALRSSETLFRHKSLAWLVSKRADGLYDLEVYRRIVAASIDTPLRRFLSLAVAVCPKILCSIAKYLGRDLPRSLTKQAISPDTV